MIIGLLYYMGLFVSIERTVQKKKNKTIKIICIVQGDLLMYTIKYKRNIEFKWLTYLNPSVVLEKGIINLIMLNSP